MVEVSESDNRGLLAVKFSFIFSILDNTNKLKIEDRPKYNKNRKDNRENSCLIKYIYNFFYYN